MHPVKVFEVLRSADPDGTSGDDLQRLEKIRREYDICRGIADAPRRFRVSLPNSICTFNERTCIDLMTIDFKTLLHVVDQGTKYSVACFLQVDSTKNVWDLIIHI